MSYDQIFIADEQDKLIEVFLRSTATGQGLTGLLYSDMTITYTREGAAADVDVTEATMTMGTHADGGFIEVDATNSPGLYQFGIPDAALASGANAVTFCFRSAGIVDKTVRLILSPKVNLIDAPNATAVAAIAAAVDVQIEDETFATKQDVAGGHRY